MPCSDGGRSDYHDEYANERAKNSKYVARLNLIEAYLCGVLTVIENRGEIKGVFNAIDLNEGGFDQSDIEKWWEDHKAEDRKRREKENADILEQIKEIEKVNAQNAALMLQLKKKLR